MAQRLSAGSYICRELADPLTCAPARVDPVLMAGASELKVKLSQDAGIVLGLAGTALSFACSNDDEAERWLRVLRMHGRVGEALQALGVPEAPLMTYARPAPSPAAAPGADPVDAVCRRASCLADARSADRVGTVDVLFAVLMTYGRAFDRALYIRGTSREELIERLVVTAEREVASRR